MARLEAVRGRIDLRDEKGEAVIRGTSIHSMTSMRSAALSHGLFLFLACDFALPSLE
jgi:hypothetical protein